VDWSLFFQNRVRKNENFLGNQNLRIFRGTSSSWTSRRVPISFLVSISCDFCYENTEFSNEKNIVEIYIETPKNQGELTISKFFYFFSGKLESHQTNKAALPGSTKHAALQHHAKQVAGDQCQFELVVFL
jgi:hypothetical protein